MPSNVDAPEAKASWVPYATMFKLEDRTQVLMLNYAQRRCLVCVNCHMKLPWLVYTLDPASFDKACHKCKMDAHTFWRGRLHKELDDA